MIIIALDIRPVPKARPRFSKFGHTFTSQKTKDFESMLKAKARATMIEHKLKPLEGPIFATMVFGFACPKSASKKRRAELLAGCHTSKPDLDNLVKTIDAFNDIVWRDDSQIMSISASKCYAENDFVLFSFQTLEEFDEHANDGIRDHLTSTVCH